MGPRKLTVLHFNDVYQIESRSKEPVGGAARFVAKVKSFAEAHPLVLFSGDAFSPSLMSCVTQGAHMVPILNELGTAAATVGNHEFDFGLDSFVKLRAKCNFPWLMANVTDPETGEPLGGAQASVMLDWDGCKVGIAGLVEGEWAETLGTIEPDELRYKDFVAEGKRLATELRAEGADIVIAMTHMRMPNDLKLAKEVPEFDLVLGGHDHDYKMEEVGPVTVLKSGTDFREFSKLDIELPEMSTSGNGSQHPRPRIKVERIAITRDIAEDPATAKIVEEYAAAMGNQMDEVVVTSAVDLDGRFATVRQKESNLGNLICDIFLGACSGFNADCVIMNSGTFRSDAVHTAGPLTYRDLMAILPMQDATCVISVTGQQLLDALENGVSAVPKMEGRFLQVAGMEFAFDSSRPPGQRIVPDSVSVGGKALDLKRSYRLATKAYLAEGKDGFDCLEGAEELHGPEVCVDLPTAVRHFFLVMQALNEMDPKSKVYAAAHRWCKKALRDHKREDAVMHSGNCVRGEDGRYVLAPVLQGRIVDVAAEDKSQDK